MQRNDAVRCQPRVSGPLLENPMTLRSRPSASRTPHADAPVLADASVPLQRGLITLLDIQTAWWKQAEQQTAAMLQAWMRTAAAAPPLAARPAALAGGVVWPFLTLWVLPGWAQWTRLWVEALQHDAQER
jgi:hypothetical protein